MFASGLINVCVPFHDDRFECIHAQNVVNSVKKVTAARNCKLRLLNTSKIQKKYTVSHFTSYPYLELGKSLEYSKNGVCTEDSTIGVKM